MFSFFGLKFCRTAAELATQTQVEVRIEQGAPLAAASGTDQTLARLAVPPTPILVNAARPLPAPSRESLPAPTASPTHPNEVIL